MGILSFELKSFEEIKLESFDTEQLMADLVQWSKQLDKDWQVMISQTGTTLAPL